MLNLLKKNAWTVLGLFVAFAAGSTIMVGVLYDKSGRRLVDKVYEVAGLRTNPASYFAFGFGKPVHADWAAVRSPTLPEWNVQKGFDVELVAEGLDYPVNMVFVPKPGDDPDSPTLYVNELHGRVKYVGRDGKVYVYAEGLTNFPSIPDKKSDEVGVSGLALAPNGDLFATAAYKDEKSGLLSNRIIRLVSEPGGKKLAKVETILDLEQFTAPSNQIQQVLVGADSKLYVSVGDAEDHKLSLDLDKFGGKLIRMELDGTACEENPYYDLSNPEAPRSYVYASGIRNAFDIDFHPSTQRLYAVDNGKNLDRLFEIVRGGIYGWNGDYDSGRINALYTWGPEKNVAPTGICFLDEPVLGAGTSGRCYVACYGPPGDLGPNQSKSVLEFDVDPKTGLLTRMPKTLLQYAGEYKTTTLGLAEGPDGLYITDFWGETDGFDDAKGRILKLVPSKATLNLPDVSEEGLAALPPVQRGEVYFNRNCSTCHTMDGVGGREGPELTLVRRNLTERLNSRGYLASLEDLLQSKESFAVEQRPRIEDVVKASGEDRLKLWLTHHLEEPRFDNLFAKMPSFAEVLKPEQREDVIAFILSRK